ncbi:MAG: methylenetetrahydrofolate reductase [NAD(P)H] [Absicoccus porci]|uniref:methylenetetrahydrofolate reductase [NAD(P)H] n=1 Tax=Absicoccus porci TaxID=2486576 RepID=UPI0023536165|nr:methylenetetrahydrofolate reductase [NAD(P)H] [Absicoccus porci]MCI6087469.1 methylenetetrahydrofolate reductase [NAD(P)H] [Absicoccus porci]MDD7331006.1 methylenetetrahydrofolate reductase [NAD(P)H] [Absicoccus porci]
MSIIDILNNNKVTISFEVFPPKKETNFDEVEKAARQIADLHPNFMSVTYGAGGTNNKNTAHLAADIQNKTSTPVLAHLTCVSSTKEQVASVVHTYEDLGIDSIMALRGDLPKDGKVSPDYTHAIDLIRDIKAINPNLCIGGACYPEGHVECERQSEDIQHLKEKVDAGLDFLTTQMFFDNDTFYNFMFKIREAGITVPVLAGIMPITKKRQVARSVALSGATIPHKFRRMVDRFGDSEETMKQVGIIYASEQIIDLISNGINHIHVYSMNRPDIAAGIIQNLSSIIDYDRIKK